MQTAKVFNYGENQAVQPPKNLHLEDAEVVIKPFGDVILLMPITYSHLYGPPKLFNVGIP